MCAHGPSARSEHIAGFCSRFGFVSPLFFSCGRLADARPSCVSCVVCTGADGGGGALDGTRSFVDILAIRGRELEIVLHTPPWATDVEKNSDTA